MTACRFVATDQPRALRGQHEPGCPETSWRAPLSWIDCDGCAPCTRRHCGTCGHRHVEQLTCPVCVGEAREHLSAIRTNARHLLGEAVHRGVESEAAHLEGPAAQPEAWRQRRRHGFRPHEDDVVGETHPLWVLGTWDLLVTEHYDHHRTGRVSVDSAAAYLAVNLSELAQDEDFAFEDLARDLRSCSGHLEDVLHDSAQADTGAPCMTCGVPLERTWGKLQAGDGWRCPRCRVTSTEEQYRFAVMQLHRDEAAWLTDRDMELRTGVKATTVRSWARASLVAKRLDAGRTVYDVAHVLDVARGKGLIA
jgi:hypothetical protein